MDKTTEPRKWGDSIPELGIEKLTPEPGCLVMTGTNGSWVMLEWDADARRFYCDDFEFDSIAEVRDITAPILPHLPRDVKLNDNPATCWDVLKVLATPSEDYPHNDHYRILYFYAGDRTCSLDMHEYEGNINISYKTGLVQCENTQTRADKLGDRRKVLLEWIELNKG